MAAKFEGVDFMDIVGTEHDLSDATEEIDLSQIDLVVEEEIHLTQAAAATENNFSNVSSKEHVTAILMIQLWMKRFMSSKINIQMLVQCALTLQLDMLWILDTCLQLIFQYFQQLLIWIANYVFPNNWKCWPDQSNQHPSVRVTFGIHPHIAGNGISGRLKSLLKKLIRNPECVGIRETGLDYTTKCKCSDDCSSEECVERIRVNQEDSFLFHVQLAARSDLPVVLHCRDHGDGQASKELWR
ncbi:tatD [Mytilus coruscus]|uniref:TatD n=1 Tax=Mytilus coruscus TaxID=42192 RepID=A0A6J8DYL7_MYTCO|nr:tatD [Mytilus coruscus]